MDVIIQSLGFKASDALEVYIHEKLDKLKQEGENIVRANVTLFKGGGNNHNSYCEIRLEVPGNDHFVKKSNEVFETAIDDTVDALQTILRKNKEKRTDRRHS